MTWAHLYPGVPIALASALLFGAATPLSKILVGSVDPQLLAGLLYLGSGIGLAAVYLTRATPEAPLRAADIPWLVAVVITGGVAGPLLLMWGLARTEASTGSLLLNLEGLATMAIAWIVFRESVDRRLLLGALAIIAGACVLTWEGGAPRIGTGAILIAAACAAWGIDNNLTRALSNADPVQIAMIKGLAAGAANTGFALANGAVIPGPTTIAAAAVLGFFGFGVSLVLFVLALRHLGAARTGAYFSLAPFIGAALAIPLLHETLTIPFFIAAGLMAFGLWMHLAERHDHAHVHDPLEHAHNHVHDAHHQHGHDGPITEPHAHWHRHAPLRHAHPHYPDPHHRHTH